MKIPNEWTFNRKDIADDFDTHVREQLPWYDLSTNAISYIARHYIPVNGLIYDIGASNGNIGRSIETTIKDRNANLIAIESSLEMCNIYNGPGKIINENALFFDFEPFDVAICYLVIMFMPPSQRYIWLNNLISKMRIGGAIIIVDKCQAISGYAATVLWRLTLSEKLASGTSPEDILKKELSLSGIQRPINPYKLPRHAIEWFRFGEFAGWIIEG